MINTNKMTQENTEIEMKQEVEVTPTNNEVVDTNTVTVEGVVDTDVKEEPKEETTTKRVRTRKKTTPKEETKEEVVIEVETENAEVSALKAELEAMKAEKAKLEEERTALNDTVAKLQEEVKITPQKLGQAIKEMGISPLSVKRDNPNSMSLEAYNSMSDTQRREWQRKNRSEYLQMMHSIKLNG